MKNFGYVFLCASLLWLACDNFFSSFTDDSSLTAQGYLDRSEQRLAEYNYEGAESDVQKALEMDPTLSRGYYLLAQIGLWENRIDISEMKGAVAVAADTSRNDTTIMPFSRLSPMRKDSILKGNLTALTNFEVIKSGKSKGSSTQTLDTLFQFKKLQFDYVVICGSLGVISLFNLDTSGTIDSTDTTKLTGLQYCFGDTGFGVRIMDTVNVTSRGAVSKACKKSLTYFLKGAPYTDSLLAAYSSRDTTDAKIFRQNMKLTFQQFIADIPKFASPKMRK